MSEPTLVERLRAADHPILDVLLDEAAQRIEELEGVLTATAKEALRAALADSIPLSALLPRLKVDQATGCWIWQGVGPMTRYPQVLLGHHVYGAHRVMYSLIKGRIPHGFQLDHLCKNTHCINPQHLEAVTARVNTLRSEAPSAHRARQTHCKRGHEFTQENTYRYKGVRQCRICEAAKQRGYRAAKKEVRDRG